MIRSAKQLGIKTVAVFSDVDRAAQHVRMADEAVHIGQAAAVDSYLNQAKIVDVCKRADCDAVHPGTSAIVRNS